jgi:hypothetical protein
MSVELFPSTASIFGRGKVFEGVIETKVVGSLGRCRWRGRREVSKRRVPQSTMTIVQDCWFFRQFHSMECSEGQKNWVSMSFKGVKKSVTEAQEPFYCGRLASEQVLENCSLDLEPQPQHGRGARIILRTVAD